MKHIILHCIITLLTALGDLSARTNAVVPFFHRDGHEIIDPSGKPFLIKGVNVSCWLYQENYAFGGAQTAQKITATRLTALIGEAAYQQYLKNMMDSFLRAEDIRLMKKMGLNCVRIGFDAVLFNNETTVQWFFSSMDRLLPVFRENNMAVLPVMMVPPKVPDKLWCTGYVKGDTMLWDSPYAKRRTIEIWSRIAAHFRDEPMILGYDLLNEPSLEVKREKELIDIYQSISAAIRAQDTNHMIVYEGNNYAMDLDVLSKYDQMLDENGCYSFHFYSWFGLKMGKHLPGFMNHARLRNRPVFCGEWGINRLGTISEQVTLMNRERDMDGWLIYMWKALELPTGPEEKKRPPYYGNWFFIPFRDLHMSLLTFRIDRDTRRLIDWMSVVKNAPMPSPDEAKRALNELVVISKFSNCQFNSSLIEALGFILPAP